MTTTCTAWPMNERFLDTGYVIALEAADDQHHQTAQRHWRQLTDDSLPQIVTTTFVFGEVITFFNSRHQHAKAVEIGQRLHASRKVEPIQIGTSLFEAGWQRFRERPDKHYSLTDCISFVVMEQRGLRRALAFDHHFEQAGFEIVPG